MAARPDFFWAFVEHPEVAGSSRRTVDWEPVRVDEDGTVTTYDPGAKVLQMSVRVEWTGGPGGLGPEVSREVSLETGEVVVMLRKDADAPQRPPDYGQLAWPKSLASTSEEAKALYRRAAQSPAAVTAPADPAAEPPRLERPEDSERGAG